MIIFDIWKLHLEIFMHSVSVLPKETFRVVCGSSLSCFIAMCYVLVKQPLVIMWHSFSFFQEMEDNDEQSAFSSDI